MATINKDISLRDLLKGTRPGNIQKVGFMQIIPLLADRDDTFENYTAFQGSGAVSSSNYGQLVFENKTDKTMIVPTNAAFMSKAFGQDHGMMHAGIISKKSTTTFNTAACVQQTQGGHISSADH